MALAIDLDVFESLCIGADLLKHSDTARALGVDHSVVSKVRHLVQRPGNPFIAGVARTWGFDVFSELFVIVDDYAPHRQGRPSFTGAA